MHIKNILLFTGLLAGSLAVRGQSDTSKNAIANLIKTERDSASRLYEQQQEQTSVKVDSLVKELAQKREDDRKRIKVLEELQKALVTSLSKIEDAPKIRAQYNGKLAFTELLSIQRDIKPAALFISSEKFFRELGGITDLNEYSAFNDWKKMFEKWYEDNKKDPTASVVQQSLTLLNFKKPAAANTLQVATRALSYLPMYGSFIQTISSGVISLFNSFGKKDRELLNKSPEMLSLLNFTSQFGEQKAILDHEWDEINKELEDLKTEYDILVKDQLLYYGIDTNGYKRYLGFSTERERDEFKTESNQQIETKLQALDQNAATKRKWQGNVELFMYKVQSLRTRFGVLISKMLANIDRYNTLIETFNDMPDAPKEFTSRMANLRQSLKMVKQNIEDTFQPKKYIEDSALMFIDQQSI